MWFKCAVERFGETRSLVTGWILSLSHAEALAVHSICLPKV